MSERSNTFHIDIEEAGVRLDKFLCEFLPDLTRSRIQQIIGDKDSVTVNNNATKNSYKLKSGDVVRFNIPEAKPYELEAQNIPLEIVFEDANMLVVNKPSGMLTHPTSIERENTLVNALLYYCQGKLSGINGVMRPGILHRLDRDTSGLLMIAKNDLAHNFLSDQVREKTAIRKYLTIVHGIVKEDSGCIDLPIDRHRSQKHKMGIVDGGKRSITHFKVLQRFDNFTFVEVKLETGRTHQIRVHFSHNSHPVAGDAIYGGDNMKVKLNGQALQAYKLSFTTPTNNERINLQIEPDDKIQKLLRILRQNL